MRYKIKIKDSKQYKVVVTDDNDVMEIGKFDTVKAAKDYLFNFIEDKINKSNKKFINAYIVDTKTDATLFDINLNRAEKEIIKEIRDEAKYLKDAEEPEKEEPEKEEPKKEEPRELTKEEQVVVDKKAFIERVFEDYKDEFADTLFNPELSEDILELTEQELRDLTRKTKNRLLEILNESTTSASDKWRDQLAININRASYDRRNALINLVRLMWNTKLAFDGLRSPDLRPYTTIEEEKEAARRVKENVKKREQIQTSKYNSIGMKRGTSQSGRTKRSADSLKKLRDYLDNPEPDEPKYKLEDIPDPDDSGYLDTALEILDRMLLKYFWRGDYEVEDTEYGIVEVPYILKDEIVNILIEKGISFDTFAENIGNKLFALNKVAIDDYTTADTYGDEENVLTVILYGYHYANRDEYLDSLTEEDIINLLHLDNKYDPDLL